VKLSDLTPEQWYGRLGTKIFRQAEAARRWEQYMDLEQPLVYVARILAEQENRFPALLLPWADLVIGSVNERLKWESFLLENEDPADDLNALWQASDFDEQASEAHAAAMVSGRHFLMIGPGDGDLPLITSEYESQVAVEIDPRTRQPIAGLKVWCEDLDLGGDVLGALYLPGGKCYEFRNTKVERLSYVGDWSKRLEADPRLPSVPFVPMLNKPRRSEGRSDLVQLKPTLDAANQFATNLMAAGESHAVSRKWAVGVSEKDFVDSEGKPVDAWVAAMRAVWAVPHADPKDYKGSDPPEVKLGQFTASDLANFHNSIKMMAQIASSGYGLPPNYMGYSSDNPPSAESILYSLERLVLRTEDHQGWYGSSYKKANAVAWVIMDKDPEEIRGHEAKWRSAATPTLASKMDVAVKGVQAGIYDNEHAWSIMGESEQTKKGLRERMGARGVQAAQSLRELDRIPVQPEVPNAPILRS
jgi:hypothetical protein